MPRDYDPKLIFPMMNRIDSRGLVINDITQVNQQSVGHSFFFGSNLTPPLNPLYFNDADHTQPYPLPKLGYYEWKQNMWPFFGSAGAIGGTAGSYVNIQTVQLLDAGGAVLKSATITTNYSQSASGPAYTYSASAGAIAFDSNGQIKQFNAIKVLGSDNFPPGLSISAGLVFFAENLFQSTAQA